MQANRANDTGGSREVRVVTIDPGHGGADPGAVGQAGLREKDVCLNVALQVRDLLRGRVDVRLTRETDVRLSFAKRRPHAGAVGYVSVHCNGHGNKMANGTETFHVAGRVQDAQLATIMQRWLLIHLKRRDRRVKQQNYRVLVDSPVPAVLVELMFISNAEEEALLRRADTQAAAARAIADGIAEFLGVSVVRPAPAPARPPPPPARERRSHTVVAGDTVWSISRQYGVTVAQLQQWNGLVPAAVLRVGQILRVEPLLEGSGQA